MTKVQLKPISLYDLLVERKELWQADALNDEELPEYIVKALDWVESHYDEEKVCAVASEFAGYVENASWTRDTIEASNLVEYASEMGMALSCECGLPFHIQVEINVPAQTEEETKGNPYRNGWIIIRTIDNIDEDGVGAFYPEKGTKPYAKIVYAGPVTLYTQCEKLPDGSSHCHYSITFPESGYNGPDNEVDFGKCHTINVSTALGFGESTDTITFDFASVDERESYSDDLITILEICDCIDY